MSEKPYSPFGDTVDLIRRVGVWKLGAYDGCNCAHFEVQAVRVDISCHKSQQTVEVKSVVADDYGCNRAMLDAIAAEVVRQLGERVDPEFSEEYRKSYTVKVA
jgi:hypothetical protein